VPISEQSYREMDWGFLEKLFERLSLTGDNLDFEKHIRSLVKELATELNVSGSASAFLLVETAIMEFMSYRRFTIKALQAEEYQHKSADHCSRTVERWRNMADRSLTQVRHIFKELELKHRRTSSPTEANALFVGPTQINVTA